jgi:hypothetical protein
MLFQKECLYTGENGKFAKPTVGNGKFPIFSAEGGAGLKVYRIDNSLLLNKETILILIHSHILTQTIEGL